MDSLGFQHCSLTLWPRAGYSVSLILYHISNRGPSLFFPYKAAVRIKQGDRIRCWTGLGAEKLNSFPFEPLYTSLLFSTSLCAGFCWDLVTWEPQDGRRGKARNMFSRSPSKRVVTGLPRSLDRWPQGWDEVTVPALGCCPSPSSWFPAHSPWHCE